jgi:hypothetical protein
LATSRAGFESAGAFLSHSSRAVLNESSGAVVVAFCARTRSERAYRNQPSRETEICRQRLSAEWVSILVYGGGSKLANTKLR